MKPVGPKNGRGAIFGFSTLKRVGMSEATTFQDVLRQMNEGFSTLKRVGMSEAYVPGTMLAMLHGFQYPQAGRYE